MTFFQRPAVVGTGIVVVLGAILFGIAMALGFWSVSYTVDTFSGNGYITTSFPPLTLLVYAFTVVAACVAPIVRKPNTKLVLAAFGISGVMTLATFLVTTFVLLTLAETFGRHCETIARETVCNAGLSSFVTILVAIVIAGGFALLAGNIFGDLLSKKVSGRGPVELIPVIIIGVVIALLVSFLLFFTLLSSVV